MSAPARLSPEQDIPSASVAADWLEQAIAAATPDDLPSIAGELGRLTALVSLRIVGAGKPAEENDRWLEVAEVASRVGFSPSWVYEHMGEWAFRKKLGGRYRFSERGLEAWLKRGRT